MSHNLALAQDHAFDLARTLMVPVVLFQVDDEFGVMIASEYDGEQEAVVHEYVAPRVMLRICIWAPSRGRLTASTQHNVSAREVA